MTDFDFDRFLAIPRLSALRATRDGSRVVVSVARPSPDGTRMRSSIYDVDPDGRRPARQLTRSAPGESASRFTRSGDLLFVSKRVDPDMGKDDEGEKERAGLWRLPAAGGEPELLTNPIGGVDDVVTAAAADVAILAASVFPGTASLDEDAARHKARKDAGVNALLFETYPIRRWDHYLGPRERHLFRLDLPTDNGASTPATPHDLTPDAGNALIEQAFDVTPDGATVVAAFERWDDLTALRADLVAIDTATGQQRTLARGDGWYEDPAISPDGTRVVAAHSTRSTPDAPGDTTLHLLDFAGGELRDLLPGFDLWPTAPRWTSDGQAIVFVADRDGVAAVFRVAVETGEVTTLSADGAYSDVTPTERGVFAIRATVGEPPHVARLDLNAADQQSTRVATLPEVDELAATLPSVVERVHATAADGFQVPAWLVRPAAASADNPAPLVVWVHGGPLSSWNGWHWRWNPHVLASRGYAILLPDPGLSTGYGMQTIRRGWGRWREEPFTDVMAAVDAAIGRPDIDADRTALMGGSFGGYMANWVATKNDRFKAIVTHASLWELRGFHGTTDTGAEWEQEMGDPYTDPSRYIENSPAQGIADIRTPMLVIHGELDHRVPISEALRLWTDLRRHGVPARFLYFPDENHWVLKPQNARIWYDTVLSFLDEHVLGKEFVRPALL
jgi:dipeptidyl aminopeptidase/acylaminoacyl peptidase